METLEDHYSWCTTLGGTYVSRMLKSNFAKKNIK